MSGIVFSLLVLVCCSPVLALELFEQWNVASEHNYHRANVQPSAADMLFMTWYETAEMNAQLLASECKRSKSDPLKDREFGNCSQNIFISPELLSWNEVIDTWASGILYFTYGSAQNNVSKIRSYAKIIWAQSHKLGCGFEQCEDENGIFHKYVCNYCPGLVIGKINTPYQRGKSCSACTGICLVNGLCAPIFRNKNAKNDGSVTTTTSEPLSYLVNGTSAILSDVVTLTTQLPPIAINSLEHNQNLVSFYSSNNAMLSQSVPKKEAPTQNFEISNFTNESEASANNVSTKTQHLTHYSKVNVRSSQSEATASTLFQSTAKGKSANSVGFSQNAEVYWVFIIFACGILVI
ncbi:cysteine-rich venom protein-like isoform X1 [Cloeon dipterum]|uniref:cysteine-rich venom protein-like isoform X1 n=1 Tax=Cloeon dipterum TaxID=197152 RepID=UPI00322045B1